MGRVSSFIVPGARLGVAYAERLSVGVTQEMCARLARPGGAVVKSNHAAFVIGHLSLYPARVMQFLKLPAGPTAFPGHYESLFKPGSECQDDADGKMYPPFSELRARFFEGYKAAIAAVESTPDEGFDGPNPIEGRSRELFPTVGAAIAFYLIGHVQVHLGQFSAWRRGMGLPSV
jgi:hypothetical protein